MKAFQKNNTWELLPLPQDKKTISCRWVFVIKHNANSYANQYKVRLVAYKFTEMYVIDYNETFVLVAKMNAIRVLLSFVVSFNWHLRQFDVKNAVIHGKLVEEV